LPEATGGPSARVLSFHATYACRHSGACCSAGWRIPIDPARRRAVEEAVREGRLPGAAALTESRDGLTVLGLADEGTCAAYEPGGARRPAACGIHRVLGHDALPTACQHFPRVCLVDPRGLSLTLSHFCPTAAALLFEDGPIRVVQAPREFSRVSDHEGLDARGALPPLLAPGMLMDIGAYAAWEAWALGVLDAAASPEEALGLLRAGADHCRAWTPRDGPLSARIAELDCDPGLGSDPSEGTDPRPGTEDDVLAVLGCVPSGLEHPPPPPGFAQLNRELVAPGWREWSGPLRRYLAARLHASWVPWQGRGLRTVVASLAASLAVVRVEAARQCDLARRPLDAPLLLQAFRMADLLLVHRADSQSLADCWSAAEGVGVRS
jgi:hypothetical protein